MVDQRETQGCKLNMKKVLATGGAGYIGTHTCIALQLAGYDVAVLDNFANSKPEALQRVEQISGKPVKLFEGDIKNDRDVREALDEFDPWAVIHFAGLKAVGESRDYPVEYYQNNVSGTLTLLAEMSKRSLKRLVFSSSATVYGAPQALPISETHPLDATNVYGRSKLMTEEVMRDVQQSDDGWQIVLLRYFNPCGAHPSGLLGEDPNGIPNNLMPYIAQVASKKFKHLNVWGDDYPTIDGTGVRDYIHVVDLAEGHVAAVDFLEDFKGIEVFNLGTGQGYSVLEMLGAFSNACGFDLPYKVGARRRGDVATCYADPRKAQKMLKWSARFSVEDMCVDHWRWQKKNPRGYAGID